MIAIDRRRLQTLEHCSNFYSLRFKNCAVREENVRQMVKKQHFKTHKDMLQSLKQFQYKRGLAWPFSYLVVNHQPYCINKMCFIFVNNVPLKH